MPARRSTAAPPRRRPGRRPCASHHRQRSIRRHARHRRQRTILAGTGDVRRRGWRLRMAHIVVLALAAAVFPTLIACVAIIISRPEPRRLLVAFYAGGLIVSIGAGIVVL